MNIKRGVLQIASAIIQAIGSILVLFGFLSFAHNKVESILYLGVLLLVAGEAVTIYMTRFEEKKKLQNVCDEFLNKVGTIFAWPILMFILYLFSPSKTGVLFTFALTIIAVIRVTSLIIKVYLIDTYMIKSG